MQSRMPSRPSNFDHPKAEKFPYANTCRIIRGNKVNNELLHIHNSLLVYTLRICNHYLVREDNYMILWATPEPSYIWFIAAHTNFLADILLVAKKLVWLIHVLNND